MCVSANLNIKQEKENKKKTGRAAEKPPPLEGRWEDEEDPMPRLSGRCGCDSDSWAGGGLVGGSKPASRKCCCN